jgi:hypothetical protein
MAKAMKSCGNSYPVVKKGKESTMERSGASVANAITSTKKAGKVVKAQMKIKAKGLVKR